MFASPGEMRVEARRHGLRVRISKNSWNENIEEILKNNGTLNRKKIADTHQQHSPRDDPNQYPTSESNDQNVATYEVRIPSPILQDSEAPLPCSRPSLPRSSASQRSHEIRNGLLNESVNTRQSILKFQLFS